MASDLFKRGFVFEDGGGALSDWKGIIDGGTFVGSSTAVTIAATSTVYTVPAGKKTYIVAACLSVVNKTASSAYGYFRLDDKDIFRILTFDVPSGTNYFTESVSLSFSIPIILTAGQTVKIVSDGGGAAATGAFAGFEVNA